MKTKNIPYNNPAMCVHYSAKDRCAAGWFHGHCLLNGTCIRCPKYESKTGLTYDIDNDDEIVSSYGGDYFFEHVIASLKSAFEMPPGFIFANYVDSERSILTINDVADADYILEFGIVFHNTNKMYLKFIGRLKG